jgi:hypothetical protein
MVNPDIYSEKRIHKAPQTTVNVVNLTNAYRILRDGFAAGARDVDVTPDSGDYEG